MARATGPGRAMNDYAIAGLRLRSAVGLPGLVPARVHPGADVDVLVRLGESPPWAGRDGGREAFVSEPEDGEPPALVATRFEARTEGGVDAPAALRLEYAEGITFWLPVGGRELWATWRGPLTLADAMTFVTGPALGVLLRLRGVPALHASAVDVRGRAVGFVGPGGAGKSTLAAAFAARGHGVLTDDVLALHHEANGWMAQPATPQIRIWEDSERLLLGAHSRLAPLTPSWPKLGLALGGDGPPFQSHPVRLDALVVIGDPRAEGQPSAIVPIGGRDAIIALLANTYTNYLLDDRQRADELRAIGALAGAVRVARLQPAHDQPIDVLFTVVDQWIG